MKNKKNWIKFTVSFAALLLGFVMIKGTLSYLSDTTVSKTNEFSIGSVETELLEPEFRLERTKISKNPYITNVGNVDCIVRMKVEIFPEEIEVPLAENPSCQVVNGEQAGMDAVMSDAKATELWDLGYRFWLNFNTNAAQKSSWVYNPQDGFWYYQDVLSPAEDTSELFTEVKWLMFEGERLKDVQDFDIYLKKEATYAVYYEENGAEHSSMQNGAYDQTNAMAVWDAMEVAGKIF